MRGSEFAKPFVAAKTQAERDALVLDAAIVKASWLRWPAVVVNVGAPGGETIGFVVASDYFAIGEADDYVRVPVGARAAQELADKLGFQLPTPRMVDLIWQAAPSKLTPIPAAVIGVELGGQQMSGDACMRHTRAIDMRLPVGAVELRAGLKKDIVISNRLADAPVKKPGSVEGMAYNRDGVGIYGWHWPPPPPKGVCQIPTLPGLCPLQGLSFAHPWSYADYSHGVRMIGKSAFVDGEAVAITTLLTDPRFAGTLSHEGPLKVLRYGGPAVIDMPGVSWCQGFMGCSLPPGDGGAALAVGAVSIAALVGGLWYGGYL